MRGTMRLSFRDMTRIAPWGHPCGSLGTAPGERGLIPFPLGPAAGASQHPTLGPKDQEGAVTPGWGGSDWGRYDCSPVCFPSKELVLGPVLHRVLGSLGPLPSGACHQGCRQTQTLHRNKERSLMALAWGGWEAEGFGGTRAKAGTVRPPEQSTGEAAGPWTRH